MIVYKIHVTTRGFSEDHKFLKWGQTQEEMKEIIQRAKRVFNAPFYQILYEQIEVEEIAHISMESMKDNTFAEIVELHHILDLRGAFSKEESKE